MFKKLSDLIFRKHAARSNLNLAAKNSGSRKSKSNHIANVKSQANLGRWTSGRRDSSQLTLDWWLK
jgi:hypothetical protein